MARSPCGALDILAHGRRWAGSVLESAGRPAYELIDGFVACPYQGAHAAFRVGGLCLALHFPGASNTWMNSSRSTGSAYLARASSPGRMIPPADAASRARRRFVNSSAGDVTQRLSA